MAAAGPAKQLEWAPRALEAYLATLERIADEDPFTVLRVEQARAEYAVVRKSPAQRRTS
jgi:hypothetical protein